MTDDTAEIERLREHIYKQQLDIIALGQEVGRLREALEDIMTRETVYAARLIARAALAEKEE